MKWRDWMPSSSFFECWVLSQILSCLPAKSLQSCPALCNAMDWACQLLCPWDSSDKSSGVGCLTLYQGSSWTQDRTTAFFVSCTAGGFFTTRVTWAAPGLVSKVEILSGSWDLRAVKLSEKLSVPAHALPKWFRHSDLLCLGGVWGWAVLKNISVIPLWSQYWESLN